MCSTHRGSRRRSSAFRLCHIIPRIRWPATKSSSHGLILGEPSARSVPSMQSSCRRKRSVRPVGDLGAGVGERVPSRMRRLRRHADSRSRTLRVTRCTVGSPPSMPYVQSVHPALNTAPPSGNGEARRPPHCCAGSCGRSHRPTFPERGSARARARRAPAHSATAARPATISGRARSPGSRACRGSVLVCRDGSPSTIVSVAAIDLVADDGVGQAERVPVSKVGPLERPMIGAPHRVGTGRTWHAEPVARVAAAGERESRS